MGFDIIGRDARNKKGEYFRSNGWWWHPLWEYVYEVCNDILTEKDLENGGFNGGHFINRDKAQRIATRLEHLLKQGEVKKYARQRKQALDKMPDVGCDLCRGTGIRNDRYVKGRCNKCLGKGKIMPEVSESPFSVSNVKDFAGFCKNSGGFQIW